MNTHHSKLNSKRSKTMKLNHQQAQELEKKKDIARNEGRKAAEDPTECALIPEKYHKKPDTRATPPAPPIATISDADVDRALLAQGKHWTNGERASMRASLIAYECGRATPPAPAPVPPLPDDAVDVATKAIASRLATCLDRGAAMTLTKLREIVSDGLGSCRQTTNDL